MTKVLSGSQLYDFIQQQSSSTKEILWVCSPNLGFRAHEILSQGTLPTDIRFILSTKDESVKKGKTSPHELQFILEHFKNCKIILNDNFSANIYIFDTSGLITSANFSKDAFETSFEVGVTLESQELDEAKKTFEALWQTGKPLTDLKKLKQTWYLNLKKQESENRKVKPHTKVKDWVNDQTNTWLIATSLKLPARVEQKIKKDAYWTSNLSIIGDVGYQTFKELKVGDFGFIIDLKSNRGDIVSIEFARIFDKGRVETDLGDYHIAYETEEKHLIDRTSLISLLAKIGKNPKNCELMLNQEQLKLITDALSTAKVKKKRKTKRKQKSRA